MTSVPGPCYLSGRTSRKRNAQEHDVTSDLAEGSRQSFAFGPFVVIPERQLLLKGEEPVRIGGRALDILVALLENAGELVSKNELITRVWPDTVVEEGNLKVNIAALRRVLGEEAGGSRYIATVVGRGYRFVAPVKASRRAAEVLEAGKTPVRRHNLPNGSTRIFGRSGAIDAIRLDLEQSRLVSVTGAGGIGKTTVALAAAEQVVAGFADGVWLVDVALHRDPTWVPNAIATAVSAPMSSADMLAAVVEFLRDRELLLVLDNCEHILDGVILCVERILAGSPRVKVLATTREPLHVSGERVRTLSGLDAPPPESRPSAVEALAFSAVQLFVDRATGSSDSFSLGDADAPIVAEICRKLDGLALAIEFAATRVEAFGVEGLLAQLDDRFRVLGERRAGPERHRTLTAMLDWSYGLLSTESSLLRAVSVFAGTFDVDGAAAVAGVAPVEAGDALARLADKSLLVTDLDAKGIAYRLLETTRTYCLERLRASAEERAVRLRHAEHVCAVLERATAQWADRPASQWASDYGRAIDDLRSALTWTGESPEHRSLRIALTVAGLLLWNHFSLTEECRFHVARAVEDLEATGLSGTPFEMKLKTWLGGATMLTRSLKGASQQALRRALEIATQQGDTEYRLRCLSAIAINQMWTGEHAPALRTLEDFNAIAAADDPSALPEGEVHLALAELLLGRLQSTRQRLEPLRRRDLRYFKGSYDVRFLADTIVLLDSVLSHALWMSGFPDTAARTVVVAAERARPTLHHVSLNNALSYACPIFYWSGRYEECARFVTMLEDNVARHGLVVRRPVARFYRAALSCVTGRPSQEGLERLRAAIADFRSINHLARMPYYLGVLAEALARCGQLKEAGGTIADALAAGQQQGEEWCMPELLRIQASLARAEGRSERGEALLVESMARAEKIGALSWQLRSANDLATLWCSRAKHGQSRAMLVPLLGRFTEGTTTRDLAAARAILASLEDGAGPPSRDD
jgi:predicted ATPase/DNA-binding winged helix-turn-helix (wHTH) protein